MIVKDTQMDEIGQGQCGGERDKDELGKINMERTIRTQKKQRTGSPDKSYYRSQSQRKAQE